MEKLELLSKLAKEFNQNHITWNLGASCMLYLRGIVKDFDDIDIMVQTSDIEKVKKIMSAYAEPDILKPTKQYKTKYFLEYSIQGIDVDVMADFIIVNQDKDYYFPLTKEEPFDIYMLNDVEIRLAKVKTWVTYYQLMNRLDKVKLLENL